MTAVVVCYKGKPVYVYTCETHKKLEKKDKDRACRESIEDYCRQNCCSSDFFMAYIIPVSKFYIKAS